MPDQPPNHADLLIIPRWIVPVEPAGAVLEEHAVAVTAGRITDILPASEARRKITASFTVERDDHALLPGLVNAHTHAAMTLLRGLADDLPLKDWLDNHIWPAENRWAGAEFVRDGTRLAMLEMIRGGITCFNDMYYFPDVTAALAVEHHIRAAVGMIVIEQPTPWATTLEEYFTKGLAVHDQYREHPLVTTTFAPHAPYTVSDTTLKRLRLLADELGVPIHMHIHETRDEVADAVARHGERPLARLERLNLLCESLMAVHMTELSSDEISLLATRKASVVHCPASNLKLASGMCPVARLQSEGINVALGTDGAASNNKLDMFAEMRMAALLAKPVSGNAAAVPAEQALAMATINGARALGLGDELGSIRKGKRADLICVNLRDPATQPVHHVVSQLVYAASSSLVSDAWIGGRQVLAEGHCTTIPFAETLARADAWRQRLVQG